MGTELVAGLVRHAADTGLVRRLTAHTSPANLASRRILEQNGFRLPAPEPDAEGRQQFVRDITGTDKTPPKVSP